MIRMKRPAERRSYFPVYGTLHPGLGTQIGGRERWRRESDADAFDLVEGDLVVAAVVEASGAKAVAADLGFNAGGGGTSADHAVDVGLGHEPVGEAAARAVA